MGDSRARDCFRRHNEPCAAPTARVRIEKLRAVSEARQCVVAPSLGSEPEDHLTHLDAIAIPQHDGAVIRIEWLAVYAGWIGG